MWLGYDKSLEVSLGLCRLLRQHKKAVKVSSGSEGFYCSNLERTYF